MALSNILSDMETHISVVFDFFHNELNDLLAYEDAISNDIKFPKPEDASKAKPAKGKKPVTPPSEEDMNLMRIKHSRGEKGRTELKEGIQSMIGLRLVFKYTLWSIAPTR